MKCNVNNALKKISYSTLNAKGQTTIPQNVRKHLGLHPGDKIKFIIENDNQVIFMTLTIDAKELKGMLSKPKKHLVFSK